MQAHNYLQLRRATADKTQAEFQHVGQAQLSRLEAGKYALTMAMFEYWCLDMNVDMVETLADMRKEGISFIG